MGSEAKLENLEQLKERGETHSHVNEKGYVRGLLECVRGMCVNPYWSVSEVCVCLPIPRYVCVLGMCVLTSVSGQDGNANIHGMSGERWALDFRHGLVTRFGVYETGL